MQSPAQVASGRRIEALITQWLGRVRLETGIARGDRRADFLVTVPGGQLAIEVKQSSDAPTLLRAIDEVKHYARGKTIPVIAVPFMGEAGQRLCAEAGVGWLDLSGNVDIRGPQLRLRISGEPNRYAARGRRSTPYAPKSSRVIRYLLAHPRETFLQRELARATGVDPSNVTRVLARLRANNMVKRTADKRVALADRALALESWSEAYRFDAHEITRAHLPARSGAETVARLHTLLGAHRIRHAFTGLSAAWAYSEYANYRLVTVFVDRVPSAAELTAVDAVEQDVGANVWFVAPNDVGVFAEARTINGISVAHPVQVWIDLGAQPERASDAASALYRQITSGELDG